MDPFKQIELFEQEIAEFAGARYAVATDCCTHAIELALQHDQVKQTKFSAYTYISVLMTCHKLKINYELIDERWTGWYLFHGTRIVDSAREFKENMYQSGTITCVSFGRGKPMDLARGGALLLDDADAYEKLLKWRYDGRDLAQLPWQSQKRFPVGFHYKMTPDEAILGRQKLADRDFIPNQINWSGYPDCREIEIYNDGAVS